MQLSSDFSLKAYNTFGVDVNCARFLQIETIDDIREVFKANIFDLPHYILGGGSNTLFTKPFNGVIIHPVFKGIEVVEDNEEYAVLRVAAGEEWDSLIQYCIQHHLYGLENLIGIPGLVGSAPVQNIGAYGVEVKDCIDKVEGFYTDNGQEFELANQQCQFGYRNSVFKNALKGKCLITYVWFKLSKREHFTLTYKVLDNEMKNSQLPLTLENISQTILKIRNSKLPDISKIGCAGSFFQNPIILKSQYQELVEKIPDLISFPVDDDYVKLAAGQLIEKAGWKGKRVGNAGVWPYQALVVVNYGDAKPEEISNVYQLVIREVYDRFDIRLHPEVNIL